MASEVDISNMALSHLGDSATVASIDPPEGSAQAEHCQRFYPIARDALLDMHNWGFCTKRMVLAQTTNLSSTWAYCYAQPSDMLSPISVLDPAAPDDVSVGVSFRTQFGRATQPELGIYTPQPFSLEVADFGAGDMQVLYTNQPNAVLRYTKRVTDSTQFSPSFVMTLAASLASLLAGPVLKGDAGTRAAAQWQSIAFGQDGKSGLFGKAAASDANQQRSTFRERQQTPWLNGR